MNQYKHVFDDPISGLSAINGVTRSGVSAINGRAI